MCFVGEILFALEFAEKMEGSGEVSTKSDFQDLSQRLSQPICNTFGRLNGDWCANSFVGVGFDGGIMMKWAGGIMGLGQ